LAKKEKEGKGREEGGGGIRWSGNFRGVGQLLVWGNSGVKERGEKGEREKKEEEGEEPARRYEYAKPSQIYISRKEEEKREKREGPLSSSPWRCLSSTIKKKKRKKKKKKKKKKK